jgi:hypothetical protein
MDIPSLFLSGAQKEDAPFSGHQGGPMEQGSFSLGSWGCLLWDSVET